MSSHRVKVCLCVALHFGQISVEKNLSARIATVNFITCMFMTDKACISDRLFSEIRPYIYAFIHVGYFLFAVFFNFETVAFFP